LTWHLWRCPQRKRPRPGSHGAINRSTAVSILRQSRRLYRSLAPQRGLIATQSQTHKLQAVHIEPCDKNSRTRCNCKRADFATTHSRNCQTLGASPAEPGDLPFH
jgi:hypothetical protein